MNCAFAVAVSSGGQYAFVVGYASDCMAVVDVGSDASNPVIIGDVADFINMDGAYGVTVSLDGNCVFVVGG